MIARLLSPYAIRDAGYYPIVTITGPRQSGKTTLVKTAFPNHEYLSLEDTETRSFARDDPKGFLTRHPGPVVFDEIQRVPDLFSALQTAVDTDASPGRFVLTGSQNFLLMKEVSQSLAGRSGILHLLPFSRAELDRQPQSEQNRLRNRSAHRGRREKKGTVLFSSILGQNEKNRTVPFHLTPVGNMPRIAVSFGPRRRHERYV